MSVEPELASIRLDMVTDSSSIVEIIYRAPSDFKSIELMGVDAGLSWVKGKSISLEKARHQEEVVNYKAYLEVKDSCEFRARGFDGEEDRWEAGLANHRIDRKTDGTIEFSTELDPDLFEFKGSLPTNLTPTLEEATERINNIEEEDVPLYQALVDLSVWIDEVKEHPLEGEYIYPLSAVMRHLKTKSRDKESLKVDEVVRPILKILYNMYIDALEFHKDDIRYLTGDWMNKEYFETIKKLPKQVETLESDMNIGKGPDAGNRFKKLLKFVS